MANFEEKEKDKILQEIHDVLESQQWGGSHDRIIIKLTFRGKLNLMPIEIDQKVMRKPYANPSLVV